MRQGTLFALVAIAVLFAIFGWRALGILAAMLILVPLILVLAIFVVLWWLRRRMAKAARHLAENLQRAAEAQQVHAAQAAQRSHSIDVQGRVKDQADKDESDKPA